MIFLTKKCLVTEIQKNNIVNILTLTLKINIIKHVVISF